MRGYKVTYVACQADNVSISLSMFQRARRTPLRPIYSVIMLLLILNMAEIFYVNDVPKYAALFGGMRE